MAESLDFAVRGRVKADIELQPLSAINDIFGRLAHGDVPARVVLDTAQQINPRTAPPTHDNWLAFSRKDVAITADTPVFWQVASSTRQNAYRRASVPLLAWK